MTTSQKNVSASTSTTQAWIIVADRTNMQRVAELGVFGLGRKGSLNRVRVGDRLIAYIRGEKTFAGLGEVTQAHYLDDEPLFEGGLFPERIGINLKLLPQEASLDVWEVVDHLEFPSDKMNWWASLVGGIRRVPMADYETLSKRLTI